MERATLGVRACEAFKAAKRRQEVLQWVAIFCALAGVVVLSSAASPAAILPEVVAVLLLFIAAFVGMVAVLFRRVGREFRAEVNRFPMGTERHLRSLLHELGGRAPDEKLLPSGKAIRFVWLGAAASLLTVGAFVAQAMSDNGLPSTAWLVIGLIQLSLSALGSWYYLRGRVAEWVYRKIMEPPRALPPASPPALCLM